ncbi:MAG: RDD family protein [Gemmatimonadetes bacterium]|nr:RDD family protein [Gemmatimonadota bacterium]
MGVPREAMAGALESLEEGDTALSPQILGALRAALAAVEAVTAAHLEEADSLVLRYAGALAADDTVTAALLRPQLAEALAGHRIEELDERIRDLRERNDELEEDLEQEREDPGILRVLKAIADDLGVGVGWAALYFTVFTTLWRGQTPGKRLLGIRVVRLDGEPISWWAAFERFGGYAAGLATGLLGFFQILWDANRQAVHDKIASTVVLHLAKGPTPPGSARPTV